MSAYFKILAGLSWPNQCNFEHTTERCISKYKKTGAYQNRCLNYCTWHVLITVLFRRSEMHQSTRFHQNPTSTQTAYLWKTSDQMWFLFKIQWTVWLKKMDPLIKNGYRGLWCECSLWWCWWWTQPIHCQEPWRDPGENRSSRSVFGWRCLMPARVSVLCRYSSVLIWSYELFWSVQKKKKKKYVGDWVCVSVCERDWKCVCVHTLMYFSLSCCNFVPTYQNAVTWHACYP